MNDELVKRLRGWRGYHQANLSVEAADRIEAVTAERDEAKAKVEQLGCELNVAKYGQPNFAWSVHVAAMAELQAERDRLQKSLTDAGVYLDHGLDKMAFNIIRAALKGETP